MMKGIVPLDRITDDILIGNYLDAKNVGALASLGVRSILCLDGSLREVDYRKHGVETISIVALIDGAGNRPEVFLRAVDSLKHLCESSPPTLVQCHAGRSRSAAVVASYLMRDHGMSLEDAMDMIALNRDVAISAGLQETLSFCV